MRVLTPSTQASITTANNARSIRRRRSNTLGMNDADRSLGIFSSTSPAFRREQPRSGAVALVRAIRGPLMRRRADRLRDLGVDQRLEHELHTRADHIDITTRADRVEQIDQVRLGQGHPVAPLA